MNHFFVNMFFTQVLWTVFLLHQRLIANFYIHLGFSDNLSLCPLASFKTWRSKLEKIGHVARPDPRGLSTFSQCTGFCRTGDSNWCPLDLELGALTKWLASECLGRLLSSGVLHLGVEKCRRASESAGQESLPVTFLAASVMQLCRGVGQVSLPRKWVCQASESARKVSLPVTCQAESVMQPDRLTWSCDHASHVLRHHVGVTTVERPDPKAFPLLVSTEF